MLDGLVRQREFAEVVPNHVGLDLNVAERLTVVDADNAADHFRHDNHVPQVRVDGSRLLVRSGRLLGLPKPLNQRKRLSLQAALQTAANIGREQRQELRSRTTDQVLYLNATVEELLVRLTLDEAGRLSGSRLRVRLQITTGQHIEMTTSNCDR